jgi:hypothetical protein
MEIDVFKRTEDNWCGNYAEDDLDLVNVSFGHTGPDPKNGNGQYRVCTWGTDDCGMEMDFTDETKALNTFYVVIGLEFVNFQNLKELGFVSA